MERKRALVLVALYALASNLSVSAKILNYNNEPFKISAMPAIRRHGFVGVNRTKAQESNTPPACRQQGRLKNAVMATLRNERVQRLALVATGTVAFGVTVYKCAARLLRYLLCDRYAKPGAPGIVDVIGPVLLENTPAVPSDAVADRVLRSVERGLARLPGVKGLLRPGMRRVPTAALVDKDTVVAVHFYWSQYNDTFKQMGIFDFFDLSGPYESLKRNGKKLVLVEVNMAPQYDTCYEAFSGSPWHALPFEQNWRKRSLAKRLSVLQIPTLVLLDHEGNVLCDSALGLMTKRINEFPWTNHRLLDLLPEQLSDRHGQKVAKSTLEGKCVGVLIEDPRVRFNDEAKEAITRFYNLMNERTGGNFEVVAVRRFPKGKLEAARKHDHPNWLHTDPEDRDTPFLVQQLLGRDLPEFAVFDREGRLYASLRGQLMDEDLQEKAAAGLSKGAARVMDDGELLNFFHRDVLIGIAAPGEDAERLELELNRAMLAHHAKRRGALLRFFVLRSPNVVDAVRKAFGLGKHERMVGGADPQVLRLFNRNFVFRGERVDADAVLKFIDDCYARV